MVDRIRISPANTKMSRQEVVGFAGLGNMGLAMAGNLQEYLGKMKPGDPFAPSLHVWNRTLSKADALVKCGATKVLSIEDLASKCTIVFSMLLNDEVLRSTFDAFLAALPKPGSVWMDCSTIFPGLSADLSAQGAAKGVAFLSTPIFGRPDAVQRHDGLLVCAGDPAARERVRPLLECIGQGVLCCGDSSSNGAAMKLVGNFFFVAFTEIVAEGMTLGEKNGIKRDWVVQFVKRMFPGFLAEDYVTAVAYDKFVPTPEKPGFNLLGGIKDVGHMRQLAQESGAPLPMADIVYQHLNKVMEMGGGDLDWSALALAVRKDAGLQLSHLG